VFSPLIIAREPLSCDSELFLWDVVWISDYLAKEELMAKIEMAGGPACYPMPCSVVGANVAGKANYLAIAWFTMVNPDPPYLAVVMNKTHYTNAGVKDNQTFSLNIPSVDMCEKTDYCGVVSGRKFDKASIFETFYGKLETAPMIKEFPFSVECRLVKTVDLPAEELFIGEIVATYCDEKCLTEGVPDLTKINPFILSMPDKRYRSLGQDIGAAWEIGTKLITR
jgi:flavin reductase (DIM6/NTAB) family NADH-FMN oxidoreductase RutF